MGRRKKTSNVTAPVREQRSFSFRFSARGVLEGEGSATFGEELDPPVVELLGGSAVLLLSQQRSCLFPLQKSKKMFHHHQYQYCCAPVYAEGWGEGVISVPGVFVCFTKRREIAKRSFFSKSTCPGGVWETRCVLFSRFKIKQAIYLQLSQRQLFT